MLSRLYTNKVWRTYTHTNDRITISLDAILLWGDNMCYLTIPLNSPLLLFHKGFPLILHWLVNYLGMVLCNINSKAMDHIMELWKYWLQVPLNWNHLKIQIQHILSPQVTTTFQISIVSSNHLHMNRFSINTHCVLNHQQMWSSQHG